MPEQIIIRFHGDNAEYLKESFFDWWFSNGRYSCEVFFKNMDTPISTEIEGDIIYVREVK